LEPRIYYKNVNYRLGKTKDIKNWIKEVIRSEGKTTGDLSFIFVGSKDIRDINTEFLDHNYETDVICFDYRKGDQVNGEIYLGTNIIKENAGKFNKTIRNEVMRVMVHGVLHIIGYDDKEENEKKIMREKEDFYLELKDKENAI